MACWRVTHLDIRHRRHCLVVNGCTSEDVRHEAELLWGFAIYLAVIRIRGAF